MSLQILTVAIPTRGLEPLLRVCLDRLATAVARAGGDLPLAATAVVVDNASPSPIVGRALAARAPGARRPIRCPPQLRGLLQPRSGAQPRCALVLLLNNDVLLHANALVEMTETLHDERVAVCGARMVFPDDTIQHCGVVFGAGDVGPFHDFRRTPTRHVPRATRSLQAVTGACMLIRGSCFTALDGFDESYPFGLEDIDFCLRARQRGWSVVCTQRYDSLHFESMTEGRVALDVGSRRHFMEIWKGRYGIDAPLQPGDPR